MERTFYYTDELNDDFAGTNIDQKPLPEDYEYFTNNPVRKAFAWFLHHVIAVPVCFVMLKVMSSQKIVGREKLKPYKKSGFFLYGNHTRTAGDAYTPSMVSFPKKPYIVVNPDATSLPFLKNIVEDLGGMPVPNTLKGQKKFLSAIDKHMEKGDVVCIYPEAHIWPGYTGIRPFTATSFSYPVKTDKPCFTFTTTYQKRLFFGVKTTVYIDGPFFPDKEKPKSEQKQALRDEVYNAMLERSKLSTFAPNKYVKIEKNADY